VNLGEILPLQGLKELTD